MIKQTSQAYQVVSNTPLSSRYYHLKIEATAIVQKARPGQFVHCKVSDGLDPFFRRPFSIYRAQRYLEILYDVVGKGTAVLSTKRKGDLLDILGPLGNSFRLPSKKIKQVVMIAGGVGVAPFLALSDRLKAEDVELILLYGGRTKEHVYPMKALKQNKVKIFIATDDGSVGVKGRVSKLFTKIHTDKETTLLYTCGPKPMMAAVQRFARAHHIQGQVACEEVMACGVGVCLGCAIQTRHGHKTVCHHGPVFDLQEVVLA